MTVDLVAGLLRPGGGGRLTAWVSASPEVIMNLMVTGPLAGGWVEPLVPPSSKPPPPPQAARASTPVRQAGGGRGGLA